MRSISCHIMPIVNNSLGGGHTTVLKNQAYVGLLLALDWFKKQVLMQPINCKWLILQRNLQIDWGSKNIYKVDEKCVREWKPQRILKELCAAKKLKKRLSGDGGKPALE